ncbi:glutaredoxin domain-containing protein [Shewanella khirikhana]|uniref:glutaredoxin domain-containing protein n=1 Tax=Shewanella khirikhana TaxID=1965282 RepID=UPI0030CD77D8
MNIFKNVIQYLGFLAIGLALGIGGVKGYEWFTKEPRVVEGDYSFHYGFTQEPVIMYGTDWCPVCANTREYLTGLGVPYQEFNPEKDTRVEERFLSLKAKGYPVLIIGDKRIFGLDKSAIEAALKENNLL